MVVLKNKTVANFLLPDGSNFPIGCAKEVTEEKFEEFMRDELFLRRVGKGSITVVNREGN